MKAIVRPPGTAQVLFTFPSSRAPQGQASLRLPGSSLCLTQHVMRPFLPLGLFVWGATAESTVESIRVGAQHEGTITAHPMPARYFETGRSMAELRALAEAGELELTVEERQVLEMEVADVGHQVSVCIKGPFEDVCLWGLTYAQRWPLLTQTIEYASSPVTFGVDLGENWSGFRGRVIEHHLGGDRVISNVYAPSEDSVCRLLVAARHPERMF